MFSSVISKSTFHNCPLALISEWHIFIFTYSRPDNSITTCWLKRVCAHQIRSESKCVLIFSQFTHIDPVKRSMMLTAQPHRIIVAIQRGKNKHFHVFWSWLFELLSLLSIFMKHAHDFKLNWKFYAIVNASQMPQNASNWLSKNVFFCSTYVLAAIFWLLFECISFELALSVHFIGMLLWPY